MKLFALVSLLFTLPIQLSTVTYNYSYYGEVIHSAPGMTYATYFNAQTLGVSLGAPEDIVVKDDLIYMIDSVNNQVVVIDEDFNKEAVHTTFGYTQAFLSKQEAGFDPTPTTISKALGLEVTDKNIYIADTGNKRILKLNMNFEIIFFQFTFSKSRIIKQSFINLRSMSLM